MTSDRFGPSRTATPTGTSGSLTTTSTQAGPSVPINGSGPTLRLRAESDAGQARHIQWAEDVIDNEGMGKKSSKGCLALPSGCCSPNMGSLLHLPRTQECR
ncbi:hypothetical protein BDZ85DRAFT_253962 [Elsinoe ampelina]|uniref:Type 1 phosphatases regulator n=1 Tax=Elsinoe ampelina TaxID=302913 RepID=A0A6A6GND2_9PEZI|nr:hypothetical protein BDZ85DRAFT_253962 [Elsinoe ampelina]